MSKDAAHSRISSLFSLGSSNQKHGDEIVAPPKDFQVLATRRRGRSTNQREWPVDAAATPARPPLQSSRSSHNIGANARSQSIDLDRAKASRVSSMMMLQVNGQAPRPSTRDGGMAPQPGDEILLPPPPIGASFAERAASSLGSRASSATRGRPESTAGSLPGSRTGSPGGGWLRPSTPVEGGKLSKRRSWIPGKSHTRADSAQASVQSRVQSVTMPPLPSSPAFVVGPMGRQPYETVSLVTAREIPELWFNDGDMLVYLLDKASGHGPSFRIQSSLIASSRSLTGQPPTQSHQESRGRAGPLDPRSNMRISSHGNPNPRQASRSRPRSATRHVSEPMSRSASSESAEVEPIAPSTMLEEREGGLHLYMQLQIQRDAKGEVTSDGLETLIRVRNMFAFLVGQVLVGTQLQPSLFAIFTNIASILRRYDFANLDGTSLGEAATASFLGYVEDLHLADVRTSREKTLEAIVLGERMKCWPLYKEGYVHAVGKWVDLIHLRSPVFSMISEKTRKRLEKSHMALETRVTPIRARLESFEFPSLFAGVLASSATLKMIDTKAWKSGFVAMRKHTILHYKARYGAWPPSAKSKKNDFEESGLNRLMAKELYQDFCDLYDMLVDRSSLTTRSVDVGMHDDVLSGDPIIQNLRKFMSEYDRSTPPVLPPVPYDIPTMPNPAHIRRGFESLTLRKQVKEKSKKIKDDEINLALMQSYNRDAVKVTSFLESFMAFERRESSGKTFEDLINMRIGQWIFLYVIMQSLPLLAIDAPDLRWTDGVEYWLCEGPRGSSPWLKDGGTRQNAYYQVAGGNRVVALPTDVVDHSVEGLFFRSHCWQVASVWNGQGKPANLQAHPSNSSKASTAEFDSNFNLNEMKPPPFIGADGRSSIQGSPLQSPAFSSMAIGLEALPLPPSLATKETRRMSLPDPSKNFDSILASSGTPPPPPKKKHSKLVG